MRLRKFVMLLRLASILLLLTASTALQAHDYQVKDLHIAHPSARPSKPGQAAGAAYLTIENKGKAADRLISVRTAIAQSAQIHSMVMSGDVMKMREVDNIEIKPDSTVVMQPGDGYHIMLLGLKKPLKAGDKFPLSLRFAKAGKLEISVWVEDKATGAATKVPDLAPHQHQH